MPNSTKILITGFERFGRHAINPTQHLVETIAQEGLDLKIEDYEVRTKLLPVLYNRSWTELFTVLQQFKPDIVLCFGLKAGADKIYVETTARNQDGGTPDNRQVKRHGPILDNGAASYETRILKERARMALNKAGLPVDYSHDCGDFVCNHLFYQLMHWCQSQPKIRSGFYHVPMWTGEQAHMLLDAARTLAETASESIQIEKHTATLQPSW